MNIKDLPAAAITMKVSPAQINKGFECYYDPLTGDVAFSEQEHWQKLGEFQGPDAITALSENLTYVRQEHWPQ